MSVTTYDERHGLIDLRGQHLVESFDLDGILFAAVETDRHGYAWGIVVDDALCVAGDTLTTADLLDLETCAADTDPADWRRWAERQIERRAYHRCSFYWCPVCHRHMLSEAHMVDGACT